MKILVTGGAGFIGSWIVDLLLKQNHQVVIVDNLSTGKKENLVPQAKSYILDITNHNELNKIFEVEKPEIVFHLAANPMLRLSIEDPLYDAKTNILGTISVLESCRKNNVKKIIYTSTGGARVGEPEYNPVDEKHPLNPSSPYGISKHSAEHYVWMYHKLHNLDYLIFCFGNVYGPKDEPRTKRLIPLFINLLLDNQQPKIFGTGEHTRDYIYVEDLAEFLVNSIDKNPQHKLFHLANQKQISVNKIWSLLKQISNTNIEVEHVQEVKEVKKIALDITLAQQELGWNPKTDIETGLRKTWEWFREERIKDTRINNIPPAPLI